MSSIVYNPKGRTIMLCFHFWQVYNWEWLLPCWPLKWKTSVFVSLQQHRAACRSPLVPPFVYFLACPCAFVPAVPPASPFYPLSIPSFSEFSYYLAYISIVVQNALYYEFHLFISDYFCLSRSWTLVELLEDVRSELYHNLFLSL